VPPSPPTSLQLVPCKDSVKPVGCQNWVGTFDREAHSAHGRVEPQHGDIAGPVASLRKRRDRHPRPRASAGGASRNKDAIVARMAIRLPCPVRDDDIGLRYVGPQMFADPLRWRIGDRFCS
jgi:hypothetical protein